jgi:hypothetical protein
MSIRESLQMEIERLDADIAANPDPRVPKIEALRLLLEKAFRKQCGPGSVVLLHPGRSIPKVDD